VVLIGKCLELLEPAPERPDGADLTAQEVAADLRVSYDHVLGLIREGALTAYKVGKGGYRVRPCDLDRFKSPAPAPAKAKPKRSRQKFQLRPPA
jgi:excisionase family DNA binding protein